MASSSSTKVWVSLAFQHRKGKERRKNERSSSISARTSDITGKVTLKIEKMQGVSLEWRNWLWWCLGMLRVGTFIFLCIRTSGTSFRLDKQGNVTGASHCRSVGDVKATVSARSWGLGVVHLEITSVLGLYLYRRIFLGLRPEYRRKATGSKMHFRGRVTQNRKATDRIVRSIKVEYGLEEVVLRGRPKRKHFFSARRKFVPSQMEEYWGERKARLWNPPFDFLPLMVRKIKVERDCSVLLTLVWKAQQWIRRLQGLSSLMNVLWKGLEVSERDRWTTSRREIAAAETGHCDSDWLREQWKQGINADVLSRKGAMRGNVHQETGECAEAAVTATEYG